MQKQTEVHAATEKPLSSKKGMSYRYESLHGFQHHCADGTDNLERLHNMQFHLCSIIQMTQP